MQRERKKKLEDAAVTENMIREEAYHIWEREGYPSGRAMDHWLEAERSAAAGRRSPPRDATPAAKRGKTTARGKSATKTARKETAAKKKTAKKTARKPTKRTKKS